MSARDDPGRGFRLMKNNEGALIIPSLFLGPNNYTIKVVDKYWNYSDEGVFSIKAGSCLSVIIVFHLHSDMCCTTFDEHHY